MSQKRAFVLVDSNHGALIVNRFDYNYGYAEKWYGVGAQIFETGAYDPAEIDILEALLRQRRAHFGDGVVAIDCGANIGVLTLEFAELMREWGQVVAIEAQERLFYALAGNIALHNCFNARAIWAAVSDRDGFLDIPEPDYTLPSSFGSFELQERLGNEDIGQPIDYGKPKSRVRTLRIDDQHFERVDLIKFGIEGMEFEGLDGACETIRRCKPLLFVECVKIDGRRLKTFLESFEYRLFFSHMNVLGVHKSDPTMASVQTVDDQKAA